MLNKLASTAVMTMLINDDDDDKRFPQRHYKVDASDGRTVMLAGTSGQSLGCGAVVF